MTTSAAMAAESLGLPVIPNPAQSSLMRRKAALGLLLLLACAAAAKGEDSDSTSQFWPEVDLFIGLNARSRLYLVYSGTKKENLNTYADGQTGAYFDFWALPALRKDLRKRPDASLSRLLLVRTGYLYSRPLNSSGAATEHMLTYEATARAPLPKSLLVSDRNRFDFRWVNGDFTWRYRNRLKLERTFQAGRFQLTPYAHGEIFYSPEKRSFTRLRYAAGMEWAITQRIVLEGYYLRQNDWGSVPQFVNAAGLAVQFYLR
jgi:hypothetical protein